MEIKVIFLLVILLLSLISDIRTSRITNTITIPFMVAGFMVNSFTMGVKGLTFAMAGWILPAVVLLPLFILKMLGAGDIKLFSAIGAIMGYRFAGWTIIFSFIFGGFISVIVLIARRNGIARLRYFTGYLKSCLLTLSLLKYEDAEDKKNGGRFPFALAVVPGVLFQLALTILAG